MSKKVIYHPDPKYYDIEEKFRSKQGTKIFVYRSKDNPGRRILGVYVPIQIFSRYYSSSYSHCSIMYEHGEDTNFAPYIWDYPPTRYILRHDKIARRWFMKRARGFNYAEKTLSDYLGPSGLLDSDKIETDSDIYFKRRSDRILSFPELRFEILTKDILEAYTIDQDYTVNRSPLFYVKYYNGKYWDIRAVNKFEARDKKLYLSGCFSVPGRPFRGYDGVDIFDPFGKGNKTEIILNEPERVNEIIRSFWV